MFTLLRFSIRAVIPLWKLTLLWMAELQGARPYHRARQPAFRRRWSFETAMRAGSAGRAFGAPFRRSTVKFGEISSGGMRLFHGLRGGTGHGHRNASNALDFQEFMLVPHGAPTLAEAIRSAAETFHTLKGLLRARGESTSVGDEGGYAPNLTHPRDALQLLMEAIVKAGYHPGADIALAMDPAASELYTDGSSYFRRAVYRRSRPPALSIFLPNWRTHSRSCRSKTALRKTTGTAGAS